MTKHVFTDSTSLEYAEYDDANCILSVKFVNGHEYKYEDVSKEIFDGLIDAKSAGRFFAAQIRNNFKLVQ